MKAKSKFIFLLAIRIAILFLAAIFLSFLTQAIQNSGFFGDTLALKPDDPLTNIDIKHDWGARHYWYWWMCFTLFLLSLIRILLWALNYWDEKVLGAAK